MIEIEPKLSTLIEHTSGDEATLEAMAAVEEEIRSLSNQTKNMSFSEIAQKTKNAFAEFKVCRKSIDKRIKERTDIYESIGIMSQVGAASFTVRKEICHEIGLAQVDDSRAYEILSLNLFSGKKNMRFSEFKQKYFYNDIKGCQEDNWTNNNVVYYNGYRFWKKHPAIMTTLEQLETEIPIEIAKNIAKVKPLHIFNSFCVICDKKAMGKGSENSLDSGNTAIVLGVIEKIQQIDTGSFKSIEPQYFVLGIW